MTPPAQYDTLLIHYRSKVERKLPDLQDARVRVLCITKPIFAILSFSTVFNEQIEFPTPGQLKTIAFFYLFCLYLFFFSFLEMRKHSTHRHFSNLASVRESILTISCNHLFVAWFSIGNYKLISLCLHLIFCCKHVLMTGS